MIILKIMCLVARVCAKTNSIDVQSAFYINRAWSEFGRVVKAEFKWIFGFLLMIIDNSFSNDSENEQIASVYWSRKVIILPIYRP